MRDPTRRNRNIGTAKAGHGADNRMKIPDRWSDFAAYWEKLDGYVVVEKSVRGHRVIFLVEPPRKGYLHFCTVQDVLEVLDRLPFEHSRFIDLLVFRQPTANQNRIASVWGRLAYWSNIGGFEGPGIYLEAQPENLVMNWGKSLKPDDQQELRRYREAGFRIEAHSRGYRIHTSAESIRACQLYSTLPHELGHYVDYLTCLETFEWGEDFERFWELYGAKPTREKEVFAHRYADRFRNEMKARGIFPFEPLYDREHILADGLKPHWFHG